jgi:hypothetical protein
MKIGVSIMTEEPANWLSQIGTPQFEKADFVSRPVIEQSVSGRYCDVLLNMSVPVEN